MEACFFMKISVVVPAYNCAKTIIQSLESVKHQIVDPGVEFEIIIVNDGSTDNTLDVINGFLQRNKNLNARVYTKVNGGVSSARNFGISHSTGEWIAFLDSDDSWLKEKTQSQVSFINAHPNINFIGCSRNNETLSLWGHKIDKIYQAKVDDLLFKMFPQTSTAMVRKATLEEVGFYREDMTHAEDGELWIRICHAGNFYYMPNSLVSTGDGKHNYGESGLSANLSEMHKGTMTMLRYSYENNIISSTVKYYLFCFYYNFKYLKRIVYVWGREL